MQCNTKQCYAIRYIAEQYNKCNTMQYDTIQSDKMHHNSIQRNTTQYNKTLFHMSIKLFVLHRNL